MGSIRHGRPCIDGAPRLFRGQRLGQPQRLIFPPAHHGKAALKRVPLRGHGQGLHRPKHLKAHQSRWIKSQRVHAQTHVHASLLGVMT